MGERCSGAKRAAGASHIPMIIFSVGLPGAFTRWCDAVMAFLAERALGESKLIFANTLEEFAVGMLKDDCAHYVVAARQPGAQLREALAETQALTVLALGDARAAVAELVTMQGFDLPAAVRAVANSCSALLRFADLPGALKLTPYDGEEQTECIKNIGAYLRLPVDDALAGKIAQVLRAGRKLDVERWWQDLPASDRELVNGALDTFAQYRETGTFGRVRWERELFYVGDNPGEIAMRAVDITGRSRCLFYGPYIKLPPGRWTAHVVLAQSRETIGVGFVVEAVAGTVSLIREHCRSDRAGAFVVSAEFTVDEATDRPVEIRVFNERASFDGRLGFGRIVLAPQPSPALDISDNLAAELGLAVV